MKFDECVRGAGPRLRALRAACVLLVGFTLAACDSNPLAPDALTPDPCRVAEGVAASLITQPFTSAALESALRHVAGPMASALGSSSPTADLVGATDQLAEVWGGDSDDTECRTLNLARTALDHMPDDPATRPDRDGIRMVLTLAAQALAAEVNP